MVKGWVGYNLKLNFLGSSINIEMKGKKIFLWNDITIVKFTF